MIRKIITAKIAITIKTGAAAAQKIAKFSMNSPTPDIDIAKASEARSPSGCPSLPMVSGVISYVRDTLTVA